MTDCQKPRGLYTRPQDGGRIKVSVLTEGSTTDGYLTRTPRGSEARETERERERDRDRDRDRDRETETETERQRDRETDKHRQDKDRQRQSQRLRRYVKETQFTHRIKIDRLLKFAEKTGL